MKILVDGQVVTYVKVTRESATREELELLEKARENETLCKFKNEAREDEYVFVSKLSS